MVWTPDRVVLAVVVVGLLVVVLAVLVLQMQMRRVVRQGLTCGWPVRTDEFGEYDGRCDLPPDHPPNRCEVRGVHHR